MTIQEIKALIFNKVIVPISDGELEGLNVSVPRTVEFLKFSVYDLVARNMELEMLVKWGSGFKTEVFRYKLSNETLFDLNGVLVYKFKNGNYYLPNGDVVNTEVATDDYLTEFEFWHFLLTYTNTQAITLITDGIANLDRINFFNQQ